MNACFDEIDAFADIGELIDHQPVRTYFSALFTQSGYLPTQKTMATTDDYLHSSVF
jgi:hypothetical protein